MRRRAKNWLIYHAVHAAMRLIGGTPDRFQGALARFLAAAGWLLAAAPRDLALSQMSRALRRSRAGVEPLARGLFLHLARSAVEICRYLRCPQRAPAIRVGAPSRAALEEALAQGKGVVFVTGHMGNWELMASGLAHLGYPISAVAKASYDPRFTALMDKARQSAGVQPIYRGRPGSVAAMLRALRSNRVLGLLIDQDTKVPSAFVPFFGRPAKTPLGAAVLSRRCGAAVVVGTCRRCRRGRLEVHIEGVSLEGMDDVAATAHLTALLEARIRRRPSQWLWFHERWKSAPEEKRETAEVTP